MPRVAKKLSSKNSRQNLVKIVISGDVKKARAALKKGASVNYKDRASGKTALTAAININNLEMVKLLLEFNANLNFENKSNDLPLISAIDFSGIDYEDDEAVERRYQIIEELCKAGCDPEKKNRHDVSAMGYALNWNSVDLLSIFETAEKSQRSEAVEEKVAAIKSKARKSKSKKAQFVELEEEIAQEQLTRDQFHEENTWAEAGRNEKSNAVSLIEALKYDDLIALREILKNEPALADYVDPWSGKSVLKIAVEEGFIVMIKEVLDKVTQVADDALQVAIREDNFDLIALLLDKRKSLKTGVVTQSQPRPQFDGPQVMIQRKTGFLKKFTNLFLRKNSTGKESNAMDEAGQNLFLATSEEYLQDD